MKNLICVTLIILDVIILITDSPIEAKIFAGIGGFMLLIYLSASPFKN